jgi:hypothetical protein
VFVLFVSDFPRGSDIKEKKSFLQLVDRAKPFKMSRIEELPDDFDESLNLNEVPSEVPPVAPQDQLHSGFDLFAASNETPFPINEERLKAAKTDPSAPDMPPAMASVKSHSAEELLDMMNKTPLFMTDIDKAGDESMLTSTASIGRFLC